MEFDELIKRQQAWIARADEAAERNGAPRMTPELLAQQRREHANMMRESLDRLVRQRDETLRRLDALIAEERSAIERFEKGIDANRTLGNVDTQSSRQPRPAVTKRKPKRG